MTELKIFMGLTKIANKYEAEIAEKIIDDIKRYQNNTLAVGMPTKESNKLVLNKINEYL